MNESNKPDQYEFSDVVDGYLACLLWIMPGDDEDENPGDSLSIHIDLAPGVREQAEADCRAFIDACGDGFRRAMDRGIATDSFGHDFALCRNGHGADYRDRIELQAGKLGRALAQVCGTMENNLYIGDDGKCYFESSRPWMTKGN